MRKRLALPSSIVGCLLFSLPISAQELELRLTLRRHEGGVECLAISPNGKILASGGRDDTIRFWELASGKEQDAVKNASNGDFVHSVAFSPDGKTLAAGGGGSAYNNVKLWDVASRKGTTLIDYRLQCLSPLVVFSSSGKALAAAESFHGRYIRLWDMTTAKQTATLEAGPVKALVFSPDEKSLLTIGSGGDVNVWDVRSGNKVMTLRTNVIKLGTAGFISSAAFSTDRKTMAAASWGFERIDGVTVENYSVKMLEMPHGKEQATLKGCTRAVWSLVFSPDGKMLVSGSEDGQIRLWDAATGRELSTRKEHSNRVMSLVFSADCRTLASGSWDGSIRIWNVATSSK